MTLLIYLTVGYAVVLVLALAIGLIAIAYSLNVARRNLAQIAAGLKQVNENVEPLENALTAAHNGLVTVLEDLRKVDRCLSAVRPTVGAAGD